MSIGLGFNIMRFNIMHIVWRTNFPFFQLRGKTFFNVSPRIYTPSWQMIPYFTSLEWVVLDCHPVLKQLLTRSNESANRNTMYFWRSISEMLTSMFLAHLVWAFDSPRPAVYHHALFSKVLPVPPSLQSSLLQILRCHRSLSLSFVLHVLLFPADGVRSLDSYMFLPAAVNVLDQILRFIFPLPHQILLLSWQPLQIVLIIFLDSFHFLSMRSSSRLPLSLLKGSLIRFFVPTKDWIHWKALGQCWVLPKITLGEGECPLLPLLPYDCLISTSVMVGCQRQLTNTVSSGPSDQALLWPCVWTQIFNACPSIYSTPTYLSLSQWASEGWYAKKKLIQSFVCFSQGWNLKQAQYFVVAAADRGSYVVACWCS